MAMVYRAFGWINLFWIKWPCIYIWYGEGFGKGNDGCISKCGAPNLSSQFMKEFREILHCSISHKLNILVCLAANVYGKHVFNSK